MTLFTSYTPLSESNGVFQFFSLAWMILQVVAYWNIFTRAGESGWKSLIPFYSTYTQYKICWNTLMFWIAFIGVTVGFILNSVVGFISVFGAIMMFAASAVQLVALHKLSLAFGHGLGFTLGLIFLNPVFIMILGFGSSEYEGPQ